VEDGVDLEGGERGAAPWRLGLVGSGGKKMGGGGRAGWPGGPVLG